MIDHLPGSKIQGAHTSFPASQTSLPQPQGFSKDESSLFKYRQVKRRSSPLWKLLDKYLLHNQSFPFPLTRLNQQVELKHGRVAMLACLGTLVQSYTHVSFWDNRL